MSVSKWAYEPEMCDGHFCPGDCDLCSLPSLWDKGIHSQIMNNQEVKADAGKIRPTLVPTEAIRAIATIRQFGVMKYKDPDNWKKVEPERYWDALYRHLLACVDDPLSIDEESGLPHLWHLACNAAFLCELLSDKLGAAFNGSQTNENAEKV